MKRCKHLNGSYNTIYQIISSKVVENGHIEENEYHGKPDIIGYTFECSDCGMKFSGKKRPKYIKHFEP